MEATDKAAFNRRITRLADVFQRPLEAGIADSYFLALKPYSLEAIDRAFQKAIEECDFFPKPVELRSMCSVPERPKAYDKDDRTYACLECRDVEVIIRERHDKDGKSLGMFASPCGCIGGQHLRASWSKEDSKGFSFADSAKNNTVKLRSL